MKKTYLILIATMALAIAFVWASPVQAADDSLTINTGTVLNTITYPWLGVNYVAFWDSIQGSTASRNAMKNAGIEIIRFPGGAPGDWIDWTLPYGGGMSSTSTMDLWNYAQGVGSGVKLLLQTNPTSNIDVGQSVPNDSSGTHAAAWVTYCKNNNIAVPYWDIGNEEDMANGWEIDYNWTAYQWYLNKFGEHATAMKAADSSIKILGNVGTNAWYWWGIHSLDMFMQTHGNKMGTGLVDIVCVHWYPTGEWPGWDTVKGNAQLWQPNYDYIRSVIVNRDTRNLPLFISETNGAVGSNGGDMSKTMACAIVNSDMLGAYAESGVQAVQLFGCIHSVDNNWGFLAGSGESQPADTPTCAYYILPIWSKVGRTIVSVTGETDPTATLSAYGMKSANGHVQALIHNKTAAARSVQIAFNGFNPTGQTVSIYEIRPATAGDVWNFRCYYNNSNWPSPTTTSPLPSPQTATCSGATYTRSVPAYSVTMLDFGGTAGNNPPTVSITAPANGATYTAPASVTINATAADSDGTVSKVDFYQGATLLGTDTSSPYSYAWTSVAAGSYSLTAKATDNLGAVTTSAAVGITVNAAGGAGTGLTGQYYDNMDFTNLKVTRTDATVNFDWTSGSPDASIGVDTFSVRWTGQVQPLYSQTYTFYTNTDDGVRLWVNGVLLVDKWVDQGPTEWSGTIALTAGTKYNIKMDYYENGGGAVAKLSWSSSSQAKQIIPQSQLYTNNPPTVSITSPANGATFTAPASITINATAADSGGTISSVAFYQGTTLLGTDTTSPYSYAWTSVAAGSYSLTARATDNLGAVTTSAAVAITVNAAGNVPPTVSITSPANGATFTAPASVTINATAADSDGTVSKVDFYQGATLLGTDTSSPYSYAWTSVAAGSYSLTAKATDNLGAVTTSTAVGITVNPAGNVPPTVSITSPANGATFTAPASVTINATAADSDGTVSKVDFYRGGTTLLGTDTTSPYSYAWTSVAAGSYSLTAKATDNLGAVTTSTAVGITVNAAGNVPPTVSITSPANGATFTAPASVTINATAADSDGTVSKVDFYQGATLLGTDTTSPYSYAWTSVAAGSYSLTAKATDNLGAVTTSAAIGITVNAAGGPPAFNTWASADVGSCGLAGSDSYDYPTDRNTLLGSGADIWGTVDAFHCNYTGITDDGSMSSQVISVQNTDGWAKAGIMMRETLAAGSKNAFICVTPSNGVSFQYRTTTDGASSYTSSTGSAPYWVRLTRVGSTFTGYKSTDGLTWTQVGSATITMNSRVYMGLAVTAHNNTVLCTSIFQTTRPTD